MKISQLANNAGVSVETVRYYQRRGLLATPERPFGGNRQYTRAHSNRLQFIKRAQGLGFTLSEIAALLELSAIDCAEVENIANRKLSLVQRKLADLAKIEAVLVQAVTGCESRKPNEACPIIESLLEEDH